MKVPVNTDEDLGRTFVCLLALTNRYDQYYYSEYAKRSTALLFIPFI